MTGDPTTEPGPRHGSDVRTVSVPCPVCGADSPKTYRTSMYRIGGVRFDLARCRCGMVYVNPRPDSKALRLMYEDSEYYANDYNLGVETENYFARRDELLGVYDELLARLEQEVGPPGDLLELGAAGGFLLAAARQRGWRVRGVEIAPVAVAYARQELELDIFAGELSDAPFAPGMFDVAIADNVLEHTTAPDQVLARLRDLVRPGGHVIVIVPSYVNSFFFRLLLFLQGVVPRRLLGPELTRILKLDPETDEKGGGYPYHILEFDRRSLLRIVRQAGLDVVKVEGSLPRPAHLFKPPAPGARAAFLRLIFRSLDVLMRWRLLPGSRLRVVARAPMSRQSLENTDPAYDDRCGC